MHYEFDGYSEASNSPGRAAATRAQGGGRDQRQDHNINRSREEDNQYPDGFYRGTGRFARENFESERRERERERGQQQQQQRTFGASPYRSAAFEYMDTGGRGRSEEEWGRVFMGAFRRRAGGDGGGGGSGGGGGGGRMGMDEREGYGGGGEYEPRGYGAEREMGFEEFLSGVFGGGGFGGRFGPDGYVSGGGGVGVSFEEMFGPAPGFGEGSSSPGTGGGYGGGGRPGYSRGADEQNERDRRGGAGMTRDEFDNMFRARFEGPSINGYASGPPPADLFDRWYTDW
ncbi:palmitoyltransferase erf2 [Colletotrichum asianum]